MQFPRHGDTPILRIDRSDFLDFRDVQEIPRYSWPATFGCNRQGEVWPYAGPGHSSPSQRIYMEGLFPHLDTIVRLVLKIDSVGKRFTITDDRGVFLADPAYHNQQVCRFQFKG